MQDNTDLIYISWIELIYFVELLYSYYKKNPTEENYNMIINTFKKIGYQLDLRKSYTEKVFEDFKNKNECITNN